MGDKGHHTRLDELPVQGRVQRERNSAATNTEAWRGDPRAVTGLRLAETRAASRTKIGGNRKSCSY